MSFIVAMDLVVRIVNIFSNFRGKIAFLNENIK